MSPGFHVGDCIGRSSDWLGGVVSQSVRRGQARLLFQNIKNRHFSVVVRKLTQLERRF